MDALFCENLQLATLSCECVTLRSLPDLGAPRIQNLRPIEWIETLRLGAHLSKCSMLMPRTWTFPAIAATRKIDVDAADIAALNS